VVCPAAPCQSVHWSSRIHSASIVSARTPQIGSSEVTKSVVPPKLSMLVGTEKREPLAESPDLKCSGTMNVGRTQMHLHLTVLPGKYSNASFSSMTVSSVIGGSM